MSAGNELTSLVGLALGILIVTLMKTLQYHAIPFSLFFIHSLLHRFDYAIQFKSRRDSILTRDRLLFGCQHTYKDPAQ